MFPGRYAVLAMTLLGCGREAAPGPPSKEPPAALAPAPTVAPPPPSAVASSPPPPSAPPPERRFVHVELAPTQGDLAPLLRDHAARAREKGLRPVAEFYADWCAPCRVFQENLRDGPIADALEGTYLVRLNLDDWHDKLQGTGITTVKSIPVFYVLGDQGKPTGKMLDGDKWGKTTPARMGAALKAFFEG